MIHKPVHMSGLSVNNMESHIAESILEYLLNIIQDDDLGNMSKLASLTVLNKLFNTDDDNGLKYKCVQADLVCSLLMAMDAGLSPTCPHADTVYVSVAMEILWQLSKMPIGQLQKVINESVIRGLLAYMDVDGEFYRFPVVAKQYMQSLCENKQLIGKVRKVPMSPEPLEYIHKHTGNHLRRLAKLPDTVLVCELYDTSHIEDDLNLTQCVLQEKVAWPGCIPGVFSKDSSSERWQDIIVFEVKDGGIFWAQIGEKTIQRVAEIQAMLNQGGLEPKDGLMKAESLVAFGDIHGIPCYFRAQVVKLREASLEVFALDYGCTLLVKKSEVYSLPEELLLSVCPPNASLCTLSGIQAPPFDETLVNHACAILANLCKQSRSAGEILVKLSGIEIINKLLQKCQMTNIVTQIVILVSNVCCNANMGSQVTDTSILQSVLGILSSHMDKETQDSHLVSSCLSCLINLLHRNSPNRQLFYQNQGIDVALKVICHNKRSSPVYLMSAKLLRIFIGKAAISEPKKSFSASDLQKGDLKNLLSSQNRVVAEPLVSSGRTSSKIKDRLRSDRIPQLKSSVSQSRVSKIKRHGDTESSGEEDEQDTTRSHPNSVTSDQYYIQDSRVTFDDDLTHEIRPNKEVFTISNMSIAPHVCAMLNSGHGGFIYFGIGKDRKVFGLEMNRDEKDEFRLGIDLLMHRKITPILLHSQFDVTTIPVLDPDHHSIMRDLYVIEISVKGDSGTIYTSDDKCFYRFGSATSSVTPMELRQLVVFEVEAEFQEKLTRYRQERDRLKELKSTDKSKVTMQRQDTSSDS